MSFCIRSISNSTRYVPTFVATAQGCAVRHFSSRQLPKHVKPISTSTFLNDFLGSIVTLTSPLDTIEENKLVSRETSNKTHHSSSVQANFSLECYDIKNINSENGIQLIEIPINEKHESFSPEINQISYVATSRDPLAFFNNPMQCDSRISVINHENSIINTNHRVNVIDGNISTKDETKVRLSVASKTASVLEQTPKDISSSTNTNPEKKPSKEDLEHVFKTLSVDLPQFFAKSIDYKIYNKDVEFVNNIRGVTTKGIFGYVKQMALLRTVGHLKYAYIKLDVLKITMHTQDNTVRVRWRINGVTGMTVLFAFWKFKFWKIREAFKDQERWHDGFSTFYVGEDGLIFKHVADKMMPDQDVEETKPKTDIPSKLASHLTFSSLDRNSPL